VHTSNCLLSCSFFLITRLLLYWGYTVTFTNVLTMYLKFTSSTAYSLKRRQLLNVYGTLLYYKTRASICCTSAMLQKLWCQWDLQRAFCGSLKHILHKKENTGFFQPRVFPISHVSQSLVTFRPHRGQDLTSPKAKER
jgi:hypothetical protein